MNEALRFMAVHAHPDDESSKGAAALLHLRDQGFETTVVTCTDGGQGDILNPDLEHKYPYRGYANAQDVEKNIIEVRRAEMKEAAERLGLKHHVWLGFEDSGFTVGNGKKAVPGSFSTKPVEEAAEPLVAAIRKHKPHILTTYPENGGYPHLDHIMSHKITEYAFRVAGDPDWHPELGKAWQPLKLYYSGDLSQARREALAAEMAERGTRIDIHGEGTGRPPTTRLKCDDFFEQAREALKSHATQVDDKFWFPVPLAVEREVWPYNDFELVYSYVSKPDPKKGMSEKLTEGLAAAVDGTKMFGKPLMYVSEHAPFRYPGRITGSLSVSAAATLSRKRRRDDAEKPARRPAPHTPVFTAQQSAHRYPLRSRTGGGRS